MWMLGKSCRYLCVDVGTRVCVGVGTRVGVGVGTRVSVDVGTMVCVDVGTRACVGVGTRVSVDVGAGMFVEAVDMLIYLKIQFIHNNSRPLKKCCDPAPNCTIYLLINSIWCMLS